jgi:hypothetical protein
MPDSLLLPSYQQRTEPQVNPKTLFSSGIGCARHAMNAHGLADGIDVVSTTYTQRGGYLGA